MTLQEIYLLGIQMGIKADPRGEQAVRRFLARLKKEYEDLSEKKKKFFDKENFNNPYSDSRILYGDPKKEVKKVLAGIDADALEVLLTDRLNHPTTGSGLGIDLLISHHPSGHALAGLYEVMDLQVDLFAQAGVPANVSYALLEERKQHVKRRFMPLNHSRAVDAAKLLNVPFLAIHTIWDNLGNKFLKDYLAKRHLDTVGEALDYINEIPEFAEAIKGKSGPHVASGSEKSRIGKMLVSATGGTSPSKELYVELARAGVGTLIEMHIPEESLIELKKLHINVIDTGHMAADSIGANLFLDEIEKKGVKVMPCSGLIRVRRHK
jgi:putative NIF3 family GTP cyclohydrolase 1 type 2